MFLGIFIFLTYFVVITALLQTPSLFFRIIDSSKKYVSSLTTVYDTYYSAYMKDDTSTVTLS